MPQHDYDLFVIGAGSGGVRAARLAAKTRRARWRSPSRCRSAAPACCAAACRRSSWSTARSSAQRFRDAKGFGWTVDWARFDWPTLRDHVQAEVNRLSGLYSNNLDAAGVAGVRRSRHRRRPAHRAPDRRRQRSSPPSASSSPPAATPTGPPTSRAKNSASPRPTRSCSTRCRPASSSPAAATSRCEFATIFSGLGVETTIVYRGERILRGFDHDIRAHVQADLERTGVNIICGSDDHRDRAARRRPQAGDAQQFDAARSRSGDVGGRARAEHEGHGPGSRRRAPHRTRRRRGR